MHFLASDGPKIDRFPDQRAMGRAIGELLAPASLTAASK